MRSPDLVKVGPMGRLYQPSRSGRRYSIWWISYWDRSQRRELRESSGSRSRRVALRLLAQREAEAAARPIRQPDARRRSARAHDGSRRGGRGRQRHGLTRLRRAVAALGARPLDQALDPNSPIGRALAEWRRHLTQDLGGPETITTAQAGMVELAVRTKLMLDSVDSFILTMESPVNRRLRTVYPVILQRGSIARDLARFLEALGLERRAPKTLSLGEYLATYQPAAPAAPPHESDGDA
jgi:hypothetical protein